MPCFLDSSRTLGAPPPGSLVLLELAVPICRSSALQPRMSRPCRRARSLSSRQTLQFFYSTDISLFINL